MTEEEKKARVEILRILLYPQMRQWLRFALSFTYIEDIGNEFTDNVIRRLAGGLSKVDLQRISHGAAREAMKEIGWELYEKEETARKLEVNGSA